MLVATTRPAHCGLRGVHHGRRLISSLHTRSHLTVSYFPFPIFSYRLDYIHPVSHSHLPQTHSPSFWSRHQDGTTDLVPLVQRWSCIAFRPAAEPERKGDNAGLEVWGPDMNQYPSFPLVAPNPFSLSSAPFHITPLPRRASRSRPLETLSSFQHSLSCFRCQLAPSPVYSLFGCLSFLSWDLRSSCATWLHEPRLRLRLVPPFKVLSLFLMRTSRVNMCPDFT